MDHMKSDPTVALAATFSIDPIELPLQFWLDTLGPSLKIFSAPYGQVMQQLLDPTSAFALNTRGVNVLLVRLEDCIRDRSSDGDLSRYADQFYQTIAEWVRGIEALRARSAAPILVFCGPTSSSLAGPVTRILAAAQERFICELSRITGTYCLPHSDVMRLYPVSKYEDREADRLAHVPYTVEYYAAIATFLIRRVVRLLSVPHKVLVTDCDNTLWMGVCGEKTPDELQLTENHVELQRLLLRLQEAGVLLCLCSKNSSVDVEQVFKSRRDMPLQLDHIVSHRINWDAKSSNILSLCAELNVGLDSFIFLDDNSAECSEVRIRCPQVLTLQVPEEGQALSDFVKHTWALDVPAATSESRERTARYRESRLRNEAIAGATDILEFLASLELKVRVVTMEAPQIERVAELVVRTNQFNLTTFRRSATEILELAKEDDVHSKVVYVSDRFGDYGLTGVLFLRVRGTVALIDTFLLSCRVLGRGVEVSVVRQLGRWALGLDLEYIQFEYRSTPRSVPAREFLQRAFGQFEEHTLNGSVYEVPVSYACALEDDRRIRHADNDAAPRVSTVIQPAIDYLRWERSGVFRPLNNVPDIVRAVDRFRRARRGPNESECFPEEVGTRPTGALEESLATIWRDLLDVKKVGRNDGFFDLGGDSVLVLKLISRIAERFDVQTPIAGILRCLTFADMATLITALGTQSVAPDGVELETGAV